MLHSFQLHFDRFRRFSVVGVLNTAIDFCIFSLLHYGFGIPYIIAHIFGFLFAVGNSFLCNSLWTFKNLRKDKWVTQVIKFLIVGGIGLLLSTLTIYIAAKFMPVIVAKIIASGISMAWNYLGSWLFVFRN